MNEKMEYVDAPPEIEEDLDRIVAKAERGEQFEDFLPPPHELAKLMKKEKITIALSRDVIKFFKKHAKENGVKYQALINAVLGEYVRWEKEKAKTQI